MSFTLPPGLDLSHIPLAANPNGSPPNFDHGPSLRPLVIGLDVMMIVVSALFVGIRTWVNCRQLSKIMLDDVFCIFGWMLFLGYCVVCMTLTTTARHTWDVPLSAITTSWLKRNAVLSILYPLSTWSAKVAIFILYRRLFGRAKWIKWSCWFGIVFSTALYWTCVIFLAEYVIPHNGQHWDLALGMKIQKGLRTFVLWGIIGSYNLFLDVVLLALPMPIIRGLKMSLQKRIGLAAVFLTGVVGIAGGILGVYYRVYINTQKFTDPTWYAAAIYLVIAVELFVTLIVSCFPACVSLYKTALRDSRFVKAVKSRVPLSLSRYYEGSKMTGRSGTNAKLRETKNGMHSTEADGSKKWPTKSASSLTQRGNSPKHGIRSHARSTKMNRKPAAMGEIVKSVDIRTTTE